MEKEFVPYELAVKLKSLGFHEPCFGYYYTLNGKDWKFIGKTEYHNLDDEMIIGSKFTLLAPLYQQDRELAKQEGLQEGLQKEQRLIIRQLNRRIGEIDSLLIQKVQELPVEKLEELGEALLDFTSVTDLETWLEHC